MRFALVMALVLMSDAALADFDQPVSIKTVKPPSPSDPVGEVRCTFYPDLMVRETGTDTPGPGRPAILPAQAACNGGKSGTPVKTEGFSFAGRKGPFLLFSATDPNGAVPFFVTTTAGKELYRNSLIDSLRTIELDDGQLHITFRRGLNGSCSILKGRQGCWATISREQHLPAAVSKLPPPTQACTAEYAKGKVQADDPSIITYEVDMKLDAAGKTQVISRGALGCVPLP